MPGKSILVVGSSNTDMVIKTAKFPDPGETLLGGTFFMFPGGKGANQAVAAARLGGDVTFIAKLGNDIFGQQALQQFQKEGIHTDFILTDPQHPSGVALITVDAKGENTIVVAQGSNGTLAADDLAKAGKEFERADTVLLQLEIPIPTVVHAAQLAAKAGKKVILNPAPATTLPETVFKDLYLITPNRSEAETLTGLSVRDASAISSVSKWFRDKGVQKVVITLGGEGAYVHDERGGRYIAAPRVNAVDTTAAGDVFNGALAVALAEGTSLDEAVQFANRAAALSVTRMGAQASAPYRDELTSLL
ncbi:ribokinase [Chryseolinea soli]|uniref:Ribokinase n=1 Tax=Chryseolinea soli TaxID=2321403 RepID=A0A385SE37_9BACT|nr:ribokinase [Chryseolinea soli]AYB29469.1 ribokinase [Chryseolinea soli]